MGFLDKINSNPHATNQILMGLGLLGSKTRPQADRYIGGISQGLLDRAKSLREDRLLTEQRAYDEPWRNAQIDLANKRGLKLDADINAAATGDPLFDSKSMSGSSANVLSKLYQKQQAGIPLSAAEEAAFKVAQQHLARDQFITTPTGTIRQPGMNLDFLGGLPVPPIGEAPIEAPRPDFEVVAPKTKPGVKKADEAFASEYIDWKTKGFSDAQKGIAQLQGALGDLKSGKTTTGGAAAAADVVLPDQIMGFVAPDFVNTKDQIEEVVQRNLRLILGSQFTEQEGARLIARAYNPSLPTEKNIERVQRLVDQISAAAQAKQEAADYFETNQTLQGFEGKIYSSADFDPDILFNEVDDEYETLKRELLK